MTATFLVAAGGVVVGYLLRYVHAEGRRQRESVVPAYPLHVPEPPSNVWIDDDTDGLTID